MALETNSLVARLRRFQPFHPDSGELIYEQSDPREPGFATRTLSHLEGIVEDPAVRLVVLTGDAGHGKTSLCARLLERLGRQPLEAAEAIASHGTAAESLGQTKTGRPLRILKDLSDVSQIRGSELMLELLNLADDTVSIVCANEGRLRRAVALTRDGGLRVLTETLEQGMRDGSLSSSDQAVHIINLNFQSVAPNRERGLLDWAMRTWSVDRRRWQICNKCDARDVCPILANHKMLSEGEQSEVRRTSVRTLFATAERAGAVITTRQALAVVAYSLTGGLRCEDIHHQWTRNSTDRTWQHAFLFHQNLFGDRLSKSDRGQVPVVSALRKLDPGRVALREVDDSLDPSDAGADFLPPAPSPDEGTPRSRRDAQRESEALHGLVRFLRRRDYFQTSLPGSRLLRMGFQSGEAFEVAAGRGALDSISVRDSLLQGLEAVQGIYRPGQPPDFLVLDPAFLNHRSRAAVVARRIQSRNVRVVPQMEQWTIGSQDLPALPDAIDWLDRVAYLRIEEERAPVALPLNLLRFELLYRWAAGLSSRGQHEAEIRHISSALSRLVPTGEGLDEITVLVGGDRRSLTIDVGERVRSGEG